MANQQRYPQYKQSDTLVEAVFGEQVDHSQYVPDMSGMQQLGSQIERTAMSQAHRDVPQRAPQVQTERREKVNQLLVNADVSELEAARMANGESPSFI